MAKTTVWARNTRSRLVLSRGRIRSMAAPVVPNSEAMTAPTPRKAVLFLGVARMSPDTNTPPGDHEQAEQQGDELGVLQGGMPDGRGLSARDQPQGDGGTHQGGEAELEADMLPELGQTGQQREQGDAHEEQAEGQSAPPRHDHGGELPKRVGGAMRGMQPTLVPRGGREQLDAERRGGLGGGTDGEG